MQTLFQNFIYLFINHKDISFLLCIIIIILLGIIRIIFILLNTRIKQIKITRWTYIGAICYPLFFILILLLIRILNITKEIDLKEILSTIKAIEFNILNIILIIVIGIIIHGIFFVFATIARILQYQIWKLYIYYRYKNYYNIEYDYYNRPHILTDYKTKWSYQHFCLLVAKNMNQFAMKLNLSKFAEFATYPMNWYPVFRYLVFGGLFAFLLIECYLNNFVIEYTKYYMLFSAIFVLWYKLSMYFQFEKPYINQLLYERTYCYPKIIYVNITDAEEEMLEIYKEKPYLITSQMLIWTQDTPDINFYKRFIYISTEDLGLWKEETGITLIKEKYIYANWNISKGFSPKDLTEKNGKYYIEEDKFI